MSSYWDADQAAAFTQLILGKTQQYGIVFFDTALRITGWNEGAHFITGWWASEVLGQPTAIMFVPEDRERRLYEHEANTVRVVGFVEDERWHMRKDGSRFWSSGISMMMAAADGQPTGFVKIFRDATHLRARMKYLENVQHECGMREHEKNLFIGTIAHEMRNPLSPLKTALELLKRQPGDPARQMQPLKVMGRQIGFLERLIEDLVDLTRVQSGKMSIAYETVVIQELLFEALDACGDATAAKGLTVHHVMPPVPIDIEADARRLQQVVLNLLNNAIKYPRRRQYLAVGHHRPDAFPLQRQRRRPGHQRRAAAQDIRYVHPGRRQPRGARRRTRHRAERGKGNRGAAPGHDRGTQRGAEPGQRIHRAHSAAAAARLHTRTPAAAGMSLALDRPWRRDVAIHDHAIASTVFGRVQGAIGRRDQCRNFMQAFAVEAGDTNAERDHRPVRTWRVGQRQVCHVFADGIGMQPGLFR